jgi:hypothetical protein
VVVLGQTVAANSRDLILSANRSAFNLPFRVVGVLASKVRMLRAVIRMTSSLLLFTVQKKLLAIDYVNRHVSAISGAATYTAQQISALLRQRQQAGPKRG